MKHWWYEEKVRTPRLAQPVGAVPRDERPAGMKQWSAWYSPWEGWRAGLPAVVCLLAWLQGALVRVRRR